MSSTIWRRRSRNSNERHFVMYITEQKILVVGEVQFNLGPTNEQIERRVNLFILVHLDSALKSCFQFSRLFLILYNWISCRHGSQLYSNVEQNNRKRQGHGELATCWLLSTLYDQYQLWSFCLAIKEMEMSLKISVNLSWFLFDCSITLNLIPRKIWGNCNTWM